MFTILIAALFLPLFPFSMALNAALAQLRHPVLRFAVLLIWPQIGVLLLHQVQESMPQWIVAWALFSAAFYAVRLLTCRDLGRYAGYLASSSLALTWGLAASGAETETLALFAFWLSLPAALMLLLADVMSRRFGAAYAGLCPGLGNTFPRLSALLVATTLAAIATPPFPGFFALLGLFTQLHGIALVAVLTIWLVWGWAATRLLQNFIAGECRYEGIDDLPQRSTVIWSGLLITLIGAGLYLNGGIL
jgi:NADH:ubiquinone oxidoreductase subunit 4 (subunit M)